MNSFITNTYTKNPANSIRLGYPSLTALGEVSSAPLTPVMQIDFIYDYVHPDYAVTSVTGSASVTVSTGLATLSTGSTSNSTATLSSKNAVKNYVGQGSSAIFSAVFSSTTGVQQFVGIGTATNGYFFGYNSTGFGILSRGLLAGVQTDTWILQTSWNKYTFTNNGPFGIDLAPTNGNIYKIEFQGIGFYTVNFYILSPNTGQFILAHQIVTVNQASGSTQTIAFDTLPLYAFVNNLTTAASFSIQVYALAGFNQGTTSTAYATRNSSSIASYTPGVGAPQTTLETVLALQNNQTYTGATGSAPNQVRIYPDFLSVYVSGSSIGTGIYLYLNPTVSGTLAYTNIGINSVASTSTTNTAVTSTSPGKLLLNTVLGTTVSQFATINLKPYNLRLDPGDQLIVAQQAAASTTSYTVNASLSWTELF